MAWEKSVYHLFEFFPIVGILGPTLTPENATEGGPLGVRKESK